MTDEYLNKHVFKPLSERLGIAPGKVPYSARHTYSDKLKAAEGSYYFNNTAEARTLGQTNNLKFSATDKTADGKQYCLAKKADVVGFYKANPEANDGQGTKIAAHRAYLPATSGAKDFIGVDFDSVATAISAVETESETNNVYDLQGRKVMNPAKGLYIVNGKKVVIK